MILDTEHEDLVERRLLQSVADVAQRAFAAAAASVFLVAEDTGELVFVAAAGQGGRELIGRRFPAQTGIAGFVAASGQTMLVDDLRESRHFSLDAAESTGYVPDSIMAAPLYNEDTCAGVLEVLDRNADGTRELADVELLSLLANQAAIGLQLLRRMRATARNDRSAKALHLLEAAEALLANDAR